MTPQHLTLLLLLPAFVLGMYLQYCLETRHRRRREAHRATLHSLPRSPRPTSPIPPAFPMLPQGIGLFMHLWDPAASRTSPSPIYTVEYNDRDGRIALAFVHAHSMDQATLVMIAATGIDQFRIAAPAVPSITFRDSRS